MPPAARKRRMPAKGKMWAAVMVVGGGNGEPEEMREE
jgi:hypothetical protein